MSACTVSVCQASARWRLSANGARLRRSDRAVRDVCGNHLAPLIGQAFQAGATSVTVRLVP